MKSNSLMKFFAHIQIIYFSSLVEFWLWLNFLRQIGSEPDHTAQPAPLTYLTRCSQLLSYDSLTIQTLPAREIEASLMTVFWKLFDLSRIYSHSIFTILTLIIQSYVEKLLTYLIYTRKPVTSRYWYAILEPNNLMFWLLQPTNLALLSVYEITYGDVSHPNWPVTASLHLLEKHSKTHTTYIYV